MTTISKKAVTGALGAVSIAVALAMSAAPAEARWGRRGALVGGLAAGAIVGGAFAAHAYGRPAYGYGYASARECWREERPVVNRWGDVVGYRNIRVCN